MSLGHKLRFFDVFNLCEETISRTNECQPLPKYIELTSTFLLYRGLIHHHHRILNDLISLEPNVADIRYFKLWTLLDRLISKVKTIRLQRYIDLKIRACGKESIPLKAFESLIFFCLYSTFLQFSLTSYTFSRFKKCKMLALILLLMAGKQQQQ